MKNEIEIPAAMTAQLLQYAADMDISVEEAVEQAVRNYMRKERNHAG